MKTPLLCSLLCLAWFCAGCYTVETMPMHSPEECAQYRPAIQRVMRRTMMSRDQAAIRKFDLTDCPADFRSAFDRLVGMMPASDVHVYWVYAASSLEDSTEIRDAQAKLVLVCKSYGVTLESIEEAR